MAFSFFDHTGDIGIHLSANSAEGLFASAAEALAETLVDSGTVVPRNGEAVHVAADELDILMVEWLSELLYRFEGHNMLPRTADVTLTRRAASHVLTATVRGEPFDPARHTIKVLVKGITYHALEVRETAEGWRATVVLDI